MKSDKGLPANARELALFRFVLRAHFEDCECAHYRVWCATFEKSLSIRLGWRRSAIHPQLRDKASRSVRRQCLQWLYRALLVRLMEFHCGGCPGCRRGKRATEQRLQCPQEPCGSAAVQCGKALPYRRLGTLSNLRGFASARFGRGIASLVTSSASRSERQSLSALCGGIAASRSTSHFDPRTRLFRERKCDLRVVREKRRPLMQRRLGSDLRQIRVIRALRQMCQHDVTCLAIKTIHDPLCDIFIRQVTEPGKNALLQFPWIDINRLKHVPT